MKRLQAQHIFFRRKVYLPCESQPEGNSDEEWMLGAIGLYSAAIPKVIEHVGFKVQTEWLEYFVLHTDTQVHRQLITWLDVASQRERRVGRNDILFIKRTVDRNFKCHTSRRICVKASLAPYTIGQAQWHANIIYLLYFYQPRLVVFTCKFGLSCLLRDIPKVFGR